jgi:hypothetical protein
MTGMLKPIIVSALVNWNALNGATVKLMPALSLDLALKMAGHLPSDHCSSKMGNEGFRGKNAFLPPNYISQHSLESINIDAYCASFIILYSGSYTTPWEIAIIKKPLNKQVKF